MVNNTILNKAYFYLKFRPRTIAETRRYLLEKSELYHWAPSEIKEALQYLLEEKYLDDAAFVAWFVESRQRTKPKSVKVLQKELKRYGADTEAVGQYFLSHESDEWAAASKALVSRWSRYRPLSPPDRFKKAASFLSRRGFSYDVIKKTIAQMEETG
ncbi:hypothetical protein HGB07_02400 [Candidatus Roizmanbacteria bacterium]|nr:hypothetical protein [Candidatus Roizmanbacteria bacterium]